jgi:ParB-like chromosome segregation protein Spo0J
MSDSPPPAFQFNVIHVPVDRILPLKRINDKGSVFQRILSSIREVGLVEPLVVFPQGSGKSTIYSLLEGNSRFEAMKKLGYSEVPCLISTDDEAYTYNHKVNVVPPIQEHLMIMKAIEGGASEERIAASLNVDVASIRKRRDLLNGICAEAIELLKNKQASRDALREFRKVKAMRQIEMAELMLRSHNFSASYAKCLLAATPVEQLVEPEKPKAPKGLKAEDIAGMEKEMDSLEQNFLSLEESHGQNVLQLVLMTAYLRRLLENAAVVKYLTKNHTDIHSELQKLVENPALDRAN